MANGKVKAPALTPSNVAKAVERVRNVLDISGLGDWLRVPESKLDEIEKSYPSDEKCIEHVVQYWLEKDPTPSWRRVIWALHWMEEDEVAERIRKYSEPLTDPTLTSPRVTTVLHTVPTEKLFESGGLCAGLRIPWRKQSEIKRQFTTEEEKRTACVHYWLGMPGASWHHLAGGLYRMEETAALEEARKYFQKQKDPTLTLDSVHTVTKSVRNYWILLGFSIDVPRSKWEEIRSQYSNNYQRLRGLLEEWLKNHPAPSWSLLAEALYHMQQYDLLQRVREQYITARREFTHVFEAKTLSSSEVNSYRVDPATALAAPLILHFPYNPDIEMFCYLIAFLQSPENHPAPWQLVADLSGHVCCFRNCVELSIPKYPGSITVINSGNSFEVHINIQHNEVGKRKCPELCHIVKDAVLEGLGKATIIYGNYGPQRGFICPCGESSTHLATIGDDETYWVCSGNPTKCDNLQPNQMVWLSTATMEGQHKAIAVVPGNAVDISDVLIECGFSQAHWDMLAPRLSNGIDVEAIRRQESTTQLCLQETIRQWLQKDTAASWEKLTNAVAKISKYGDVMAKEILRKSGTGVC